jgi:hypothetical protein
LSFEALSSFFDSPAAVVRRAMVLADRDPPTLGARAIVNSVKANVHFEGLDFEKVLERWEQRDREAKEKADVE